ncbi:MAG TPA: hypothetical protein VFI78_05050 [Salinimicrobium sp.]|nr:hypothetical protein [Salinimicrobium sp.]
MNRSIQYAATLLIFCSGIHTAWSQNNSTADAKITECKSQQCFAIKFKTCDPATYTIVTGMGTAKYEILGKEEDGCRVKLIYLKNPNPSWENKPLICTYDNTITFKKAAKKALIAAMMGTGETDCQGELLDLL